MQSLEVTITRKILLIRIFPLYASSFEVGSIEKAVGFLDSHDENSNGSISFIKYDIEIIYTNGDKLKGEFTNRETARQFILSYLRI